MSTSLPAPATPGYRERATTQLSVASLVLAACTGLLLLLGYAGKDRAGSGTWPAGTAIKSLEALQLDAAEIASFDAAVFGPAGRSAALSLAAPRLPAMLPLADESLWQSPKGTQLRQEARPELSQLQECWRRGACSAGMMEQRGREAAKRLGVRGATASVCDLTPHELEADKRVPLGLLAAALAWVPECREQALSLLEAFEQRAATSRLADAQREMAMLYVRFNRAKLRMDGGAANDAEYLGELRAIRSKIRDSEQGTAYLAMKELPTWGLSLSELRAEWMLAEARAAANANRGKALEERIAALLLFEPVPERRVLLGEEMTAGEARLRGAWCALALRFNYNNSETAAGTLAPCIDALAAEPTFPTELRCAFGTRQAILAGDWQPDAIRYCENTSGVRDGPAKLLERVASRHQTWREAVSIYQTLPQGPERRALFAYLDAYAVRTDNRATWFWHEHPALYALVVLSAVAVALGWIWWLWAVLWRRRSLWRFLPPKLAADQ